MAEEDIRSLSKMAGFPGPLRLTEKDDCSPFPGAAMLAVTVLVSTLSVAPPPRPRDCPRCGAYAGPNVARVLDPYLRQVNVWPEFTSATCQFEVSRGAFVTLSRAACVSETTYRAARGIGS